MSKNRQSKSKPKRRQKAKLSTRTQRRPRRESADLRRVRKELNDQIDFIAESEEFDETLTQMYSDHVENIDWLKEQGAYEQEVPIVMGPVAYGVLVRALGIAFSAVTIRKGEKDKQHAGTP